VQVLTQTEIYFESIEELVDECVDIVDDVDTTFSGQTYTNGTITQLMEDLAHISVDEVIEFFAVLLEVANCGSVFLDACYDYWELHDPAFCEEVRDGLEY